MSENAGGPICGAGKRIIRAVGQQKYHFLLDAIALSVAIHTNPHLGFTGP